MTYNKSSQMVNSYSLGFMFSPDLQEVVLIRKNRPEWQSGRLNGIGGKIEPGESSVEAMVREFEEETGLEWRLWKKLGQGKYDNGVQLHLFCATSAMFQQCQTQTDETVVIIPVCNIPGLHSRDRIISNISWIIPMAIWFLRGDSWTGEHYELSLHK